ncbi:hypothetical protein B5X24_HaOG208806 [Helicoverpa armigera]|uniref:Uncharacterized protein n=1 Tax=Helicoverpa armigera TaxID=29058 RepID=A0A2W1BJD0_HELAM|nr:hypothetical protein B5X24_HaOG208806 [Helicoverpa armigera]
MSLTHACDVLPADYRLRRLFSYKEISRLRRTYYSAQAFAQTQVHSLFLHSHSPMGWQSDTTGKRSGAGPTFTCSLTLGDAHTHVFYTRQSVLTASVAPVKARR